MDKHDIHGIKNVGFHSGTDEAIDFLRNGLHRETAETYFNLAKRIDKTFFTDSKGNKFVVKHKLDKNGESLFSVGKKHS